METPGTSATSLNVLSAWTIYSPLYWALAIVVVTGISWLLMRRNNP
jgi:hypothetical protein